MSYTSWLFYPVLLLTVLSCARFEKKKDPGSQEVKLSKAKLEFRAKALLGEGAFWDHRGKRLFWVDIEGRKLHFYSPGNGKSDSVNLPSRAGTVVPRSDSTVVLALEDGVYQLNIVNGKLSLVSSIESDVPTNRFNDGKCDPLGNLWVGTMRLDETVPAAALYKVEPSGKTTKMLDSITISNGIVWTRDKKTMFYIDTPTGVIREFDFDPLTATISNERIAVTVPDTLGFPDGMAIDENDHLWVALWNGNAVACFNPKDGALVQKVEVPAHNVTSCAFGGPELDILYITTASVDMTDEEKKKYPMAGSLFAVKPGVKGVKSTYFGKP